MKLLCFLHFVALCFCSFAQTLTPYENGNGNQTTTYREGLAFWESLAKDSEYVNIEEYGSTDSGHPLHIITVAGLGGEKKVNVLINNGIHPGEPDGTDATMMLIRDMVQKNQFPELLKSLRISIIPFYNVGGTLNRNSTTRVNQNGPESYGFRGNAKNLDLNRDFIKMDSKNAKSFAAIYHQVNPDFYIETHVSNGADYQYTITIVETQHNKLGGSLGSFFNEKLMPEIHQKIQKGGELSTPYVNAFGRTPEEGFSQFFESPRYSSGYVSLFQTPGVMMENHMLKPYPKRVKAAYLFLESTLQAVENQKSALLNAIAETKNWFQNTDSIAIEWSLDRQQYRELEFHGYEAEMRPSSVTGKERLYYNREKPFVKTTRYYDQYTPRTKVKVPEYYVIPQSWSEVIDRLRVNEIEMIPFKSDTSLKVEAYRIVAFEASSRPYEGHFPIRNIETEKLSRQQKFSKGDLLISTKQPGRRFLVETLEPLATDSYFRWNFFDPILQQKEYFSGYVFEETAAAMLEQDAELKAKFEKYVEDNPDLGARAQLDFIYRNSPHYEKSHMIYPVYRISK